VLAELVIVEKTLVAVTVDVVVAVLVDVSVVLTPDS